jgi:tetratricopeptide (TPR) repeat protein
MMLSKFNGFIIGCFLLLVVSGCAGKYVINTYPAGAKVYVKDVLTKERKLLGVSPIQVLEESKLGEVFFLEFEKDSYQNKEVMIKVNAGESLTVTSRLDPLSTEKTGDGTNSAKNDEKNPPQPPPKDDQKKKDWQAEIDDLKLRVALLENTSSVYKDAIFSARYKGGPAAFDRDDNQRLIGFLFEGQQAIMKGDYKSANLALDKAIQIDEYSSQAWLLKGSVAYLNKNLPDAKKAWERTLKIDPYNKSAYHYLGEVYKRLGMTELPAKGPETRYPTSVRELEKRKD